MKQLKIAFATSIQSDVVPFITALKSINERFGDVINACFWVNDESKNKGANMLIILKILQRLPKLHT
jgi:hypothetical protein